MAINEGLRNIGHLLIETAYEWSRTETGWLDGAHPRLHFLPGQLIAVLVPAWLVRTAGRASSRRTQARPVEEDTNLSNWDTRHEISLTYASEGLG